MIHLTRAATLAALVMLAACQLDGRLVSAGSSARILDGSDPLDIEPIARAMCEPSANGFDGQISRLSTVDKLVEFFEQQVSGKSHALFKCKQQHGEALRLLQEALNASKENVCSATKVALIEDFHNKFVLGLESDEEAQREVAPQLLRLFFMHYAMKVDVVCRQNLVRNVELGLKQKLGDDINDKLFELKDQSSAHLGAVFKSSMQKFNDLNPVEKFEDVLLVWNLIDNSHLGEKLAMNEVMIDDELDAQTGDPIRLLVKLKSRGDLDKIRDHCRYNLKPIYSKLILPIIKLADLGYAKSGEQSSEEVKRWSRATQMCEALIPIKYYEDPSLGSKDVVAITKREAAKLDAAAAGEQSVAKPKVQLVYEPDTNSMEGFDRLESVATLDARELIESVESNSEARRHGIERAVIKLVHKLKNGSEKSRVGHVFLSKPTSSGWLAHLKPGAKADQFAKEEVGEELSESLESMSDADIEGLDEGEPSIVPMAKGEAKGAIRKCGLFWTCKCRKRRSPLARLMRGAKVTVVLASALAIAIVVAENVPSA